VSDSFKTESATASYPQVAMMTRRELLACFACMMLASSVVGEGQPMDQRISIITLGVKNLAASRRFYVDGLGWKPVYENKEIIFFQTGGMVFALFLRDKLAEDFQANPAMFGRAPMALPTMFAPRSKWTR
jgi:catechol-2,3-dioxygenase